jgi:alkane 1-monooxygenase
MDRRVLELPHIDGDLARVNIDPDRREEIHARYGRPAAEPAAA